MIRHVWSVLCSKVSVDRDSNNVSLFEVIESLQLTTAAPVNFPANVPFEGTLVTLWARQRPDQPVTGQMRVRLLAPNGDQLGTFNSEIDLNRSTRNRVIGSMSGLRIAGEGVHEIEVAWRVDTHADWHVATSLPLEIAVRVDPAIAQPRAEHPA